MLPNPLLKLRLIMPQIHAAILFYEMTMKLLYCYLTEDTDGSKIHIDNFMVSIAALGEIVVDAGRVTPAFTGNKAEWSLAKRIWAKLLWLRLNVIILVDIYCHARRGKSDLLLFRFMPNHQLFLPIFLLSFLYPVVLELNAVRAIDNPNQSDRLIDLLDRLSFWRAKRCFVVSNLMKDFMLRRYQLTADRVAVVENGVDVDVFKPNQTADDLRRKLGFEGRFVVGFVGSFKPWHGIENLIAVAEQVKPHCPDITFLIVGDGKERARFESKVVAKGLSEAFLITGFVPHEGVRDYLALMDVALAPFSAAWYQKAGGFYGSPLKIFEYMAMAMPTIAPPLGQIEELIVDGESGRLIYAEDPAAMRDEILRLYADSDYRQRLGTNARRRVETLYTWKANAEKVRTLCREALGQYA